MTIYQLLNDQNNLTTIVQLIRNKVEVNKTTIRDISIFDRFYQLEGPKTERYNTIAFEFQLHPQTVRGIITKLNRNAR